MHSKTYMLYSVFVCMSCNTNIPFPAKPGKINGIVVKGQDTLNDTNPYTHIGGIPLPGGFVRIKGDNESFASWLRNVKLKKDRTVFQYDGMPKSNQTAQFAVLDISIGDKDLQQCADAVIRLRAEYLFALKKYHDIAFADNAGKIYQFNEPYTHAKLQLFLQKVFGMCGTASLAKQLKSTSFKGIEPGNVIIRGGFPGHAVIVMDVALNKEGKKIYLLAQSYMPAQDIHVLTNPMNKILSPWYEVNEENLIQTPEYTFSKGELREW